MTVCTETHKQFRGFWSAENREAKIWCLGWLTIYIFKYSSFMEMLKEIENALNRLGVPKENGEEIKLHRYL